MGRFCFVFSPPFDPSSISFSKDSDNGDYDYELSLEMKRQKIQNELMKLEQENLDKREELHIKKEVQTLVYKSSYTIMSRCLFIAGYVRDSVKSKFNTAYS